MSEELNINDKKRLSIFSKVLYYLFKIGRYCVYFVIMLLIAAIISIPSLVNHTKLKENDVVIKYTDSTIRISEEKGKTTIYSDDEKIGTEKDNTLVKELRKYLNKYSKKQIITYAEITMMLFILYIYIISLVLKNAEKILKTIVELPTPFIKENVILMKNVVKFELIAFAIPAVSSFIFNCILKVQDPFTFVGFDIVKIMIIIVIYYLFKYAYQLQNSSKEKLFDDKN